VRPIEDITAGNRADQAGKQGPPKASGDEIGHRFSDVFVPFCLHQPLAGGRAASELYRQLFLVFLKIVSFRSSPLAIDLGNFKIPKSHTAHVGLKQGDALMSQYFFDVVGHEGSALDYTGRELRTDNEAYDVAELLAFDLAVKNADEGIGSKVTVSDVYGHKLFSVPIKHSYLSRLSDPESRGALTCDGHFSSIARSDLHSDMVPAAT
jgi:Domain of unknown function (DUF6894)